MELVLISLVLCATLFVTTLINRRCYNGITRILGRSWQTNAELRADKDHLMADRNLLSAELATLRLDHSTVLAKLLAHKRLERERVSEEFYHVMGNDFCRLTGEELYARWEEGNLAKEDAKLDEFIETVKRS